jgi:deoxyribose-phosphate aldolase
MSDAAVTNLAQYIDHTLLRPDALSSEVETLCEEASEYGFCAVCVNPCWVSNAKRILEDTEVKVCTVVGFPLGATTAAAKAFETEQAINDGADEIDMVINNAFLREGDHHAVIMEIGDVVAAAQGRCVKVIIETALLSEMEIVMAAQCVETAGAQYVKTSTGFCGKGATLSAVKLIRANISEGMKIKASGGIRTREAALAFVEAGATRLGMSAGVSVVQG